METKKEITERIKSFEDACTELGIKSELPKTDHLPETYQKSVISFYKLCVITSALNEGWASDPTNNPYETTYFPWFFYSGAYGGFVYSITGNAPSDATATLGALLRYKTSTIADYSGQQFIDLWEDYLMH